MTVKQQVIPDTLPGYTALQYIESTGTHWIDTGVKPTNNTNFDYDFEFISVASWNSSKWISIIGERALSDDTNSTVDGYNMLSLWVNKDTFQVAVNYGSVDTGGRSGTNANGRHVYKKSGNTFYIDDKSFYSASVSFSANYPIYVFGCNESGVNELRTLKGRVYSLQISNGTTLIRNYIPAKRDSDGVVGLYDLVNSKFYTRAEGQIFGGGSASGSFIGGPVI